MVRAVSAGQARDLRAPAGFAGVGELITGFNGMLAEIANRDREHSSPVCGL